MPYLSQDLTVIVPTKDRPAKLRDLLDSLAAQRAGFGRVIVADGGDGALEVCREFDGRLSMEHLRCRPPGQIRQRNTAIARLGKGDRLVAFLDDDMVLRTDAIERMLALWNRVPAETAAIGFNLEGAASPPSFFKRIFLIDHPRRGAVLCSGANTGIGGLTHSVPVRWLGGGYTVWRREILARHPYAPLNTRWAIGEDLRYSYPIGKRYPLFVCAGARARHEHISHPGDMVRLGRYRGEKIVMASLYFVRCHPEMSLAAAYWMLAGWCAGRLLGGIGGRRHLLREGFGMAAGILRSLAAGAHPGYLYRRMED